MFRLSCFLILISQLASAQTDMTSGYEMLDNGNLDEAVVFFSRVVEQQPDNKTANICLGRAIGLSGNPVKALAIFAEADKIYPNDYELGLNIAEAYLWNELPRESLKVYQNLLEQDGTNYTANLGMANCYYELEDYEQALRYIDKAIMIDPKNLGTYNSKKYILLALAAGKTKQFNFQSAIDQLNLILEFKPLDGLAIINKGINFINLEDYSEAENNFQELIDNSIELVESNILMSHLSMLKHKEKDAVYYAEQAILAANTEDQSKQLRAGIQKVNALGASKNFKKAFVFLEGLSERYGEKSSIVMARARLNVWDREAVTGLQLYQDLSEENFDSYMGKAEAYLALNRNQEALEALDSAILLNPNSLDAIRLKAEILAKNKLSIEVGGNRSSDDGLNMASEYYSRVNIPYAYKHQFHLHAGTRSTSNETTEVSANQVQVFAGDRIQINHLWNLNTSIGLISHENEIGGRSLTSIVNGDLRFQCFKHQTVNVAFNRSSLKYSSDLIKSGLIANKFTLGYQYIAAKRPGLVVQFNRANFNDGNTNFSVFGSLFYEFMSFPLIKMGVNATHLSFSDQQPAFYFSPSVYRMGEVFLQGGNNYDLKAKFTYSVLLAIGKQQIDNKVFETIQRVDIQLGYRFKSKVSLNVNYFTNSAATSNLKAYSYQRFGLKLIKTL